MQKNLSKFISILTLFIFFALSLTPIFNGLIDNAEIYKYSYSSNCQITDNFFCLFKTGESGELIDGVEMKDVILAFNAEIVLVEETGENANFYCYSPKINGYTTLKGKKVNLHFAKSQRKVKVGSPIIFGSF